MKKQRLLLPLAFTLASLAPSAASAEPKEKERGFGATIGASMNSEVLPMRLTAAGLYHQDQHQLELGVGFHPFIRSEQTILSTDFNYKLFPNGRDNKLDMYMLANLSYINTSRETFYPTTYHYLFLHGGYGVELNGLADSYIDTNVSFGGFTYSKKSENPATSYLDAERLFRDFGVSINLQVNVGYRF